MDTSESAPIVSLVALPYGQSLIYGHSCRKEELQIVAMTDDGQGFIVVVRNNDDNADHENANDENNDPAYKIMDFHTMNFGVSCLCVIPSASSGNSPPSPTTTTTTSTINTTTTTTAATTTTSPSKHDPSPRQSKDNSRKQSPVHHQDLQLLVGYQSGYVENWKIFRFSSEKVLAKMLWRGIYPRNYSIQDMVPLNITQLTTMDGNDNAGSGTTNQDDTPSSKVAVVEDSSNLKSSNQKPSFRESSPLATTTHKKGPAAQNDIDKEHSRYLLLSLYSPTETMKTAAMMEVIDIGPLVKAWKDNDTTTIQQQQQNQGMSGRLRAINLNQRWIMPAPGMELLNSYTLAMTGCSSGEEDLPKRAHIIPSMASGSLCTMPEGNGAVLPDGTIALVHATENCDDGNGIIKNNNNSGELQWGIANAYNQLLLPFPAVGCAPIYYGTGTKQQQDSTPHIACCLRGGSTYLIPQAEACNRDTKMDEEVTDSPPVIVFTFDTETHARFVTDFTAGNLIVSSSNNNKEASLQFKPDETARQSIPVLVYGWAGGIIDVYSCELMESNKASCRPMITHREVSALEELLRNGSLGLLIQLLSGLVDSDPLLRQSLWRKGRRECRQESFEGVTANDLLLPKFTAVRSLLLLLSATEQ